MSIYTDPTPSQSCKHIISIYLSTETCLDLFYRHLKMSFVVRNNTENTEVDTKKLNSILRVFLYNIN